MNWETLTLPKGLGGLGITAAKNTNISLLGKLVWSMINDDDKLWVKVLKDKYLGNSSIWSPYPCPTPSLIWRSLTKTASALQDGLAMKINSGNSSVWYSDWSGRGKLCNLVDFVHISDTQMRLWDIWIDGSWRFNQLATIIPEQVKNLFLNVTIDNLLHEDLPDCWSWKGNNEGIYNASSGYSWLNSRMLIVSSPMDWKWIWKLHVPAKIQFFIWLVCHQALPTNAMRHRRHLSASPLCKRCGAMH